MVDLSVKLGPVGLKNPIMPASGFDGFRQFLQSPRTSRCERQPMVALASKNGSMPISIKRANTPAAFWP